ncbi:hypothetical protein CspHIS471_0101060 [Cutaneotrichosporon sp. HIS471]|nr:hypothetical protein CspHIS471_0101060 [Cutaneotrichosporon sp. HIS471]
MFSHWKHEQPKAATTATSAALGTSPTGASTSPLHDRAMADVQKEATQERPRRWSLDFEMRRGSNPLSRGINP